MEYLKIHTEEELNAMTDDIYCEYEDKLYNISMQLGIKADSINEMEEKLLNILNNVIDNNVTNNSVKYTNTQNNKLKNKINKSIEKTRKTFISFIENYVGNGKLILPEIIETKLCNNTRFINDDSFLFNVIINAPYYDTKYNVMCQMDGNINGYGVKLNDLPIETLLKIIQYINDDNIEYYDDYECVVLNNDKELIKKIFKNSKLIEFNL